MSALPEFRLETHFSRWEFTARHHLTASDPETLSVRDLLTLADDVDRRAWHELRLGYTEVAGDPALRQGVAATYACVDADDVVCFAGAEEALYLAMHVLLGPDDHAVVVTPNYQSAETVPLSLCAVTGVPLDPDRNWALDLGRVEAALRPNTRVVSVNFPHNPTGAVPTPDDFRALVRLCDDRGVRLFSDEVYRGVERDPARTLPQAADLSDRALSLNVLSKAYGLPGLRIGWIACRDRSVLARPERAKHYTTICNAGPSEVLARIALKSADALRARVRDIVLGNVPVFDAFFAEFADLFDYAPPDGGCVCYPRYRGPDGVEALCASVLHEAGVLLLPASIYRSALTDTPPDRFRISLGRLDAPEGLDAFATWLRHRRAARRSS